MSSINELSLLPQNNMFIPNDRIHRGNAINDFKKTLHNTDGKFLDWKFNSSLRSKYGHTLLVKQGTIKYEGNGFILAKNTILQYNYTNNFPKKNLSVKIKANTKSSQINVNLGGFQFTINSSVITPSSRQGIINYSLTYEDDTLSTFPVLTGFTQFIDGFVQNTENDYQFIIDNDNEEVAALVNGVVLAIESFSHLENIKIDNTQLLTITSGANGDVKISELIITQTDILQESIDNLFSLRAFLISESLVFYNPTDTANVGGDGRGLGSTLYDIGPNKSHLDITTTIYLNDNHFIFNDTSTTSMLKNDAMANITPGGELLNFTVNMWFYIQNSNNTTNEQTLLVIGEVGPSNKSITLSIQKTDADKFKLSLKHYPSNMTLNDYLFEKNTWYSIAYVKTIRDYLFYVDGLFVSTIRDIYPNNLPDDSPISIGRDHSRLSFSPLTSTRVGVVSIYQQSMSDLEINALYNDYKINFQNIPLVSDALATFDLTKGETVSRDEIKDLSGSGNDIDTIF
jgi:hypothetical protein